MLADMVAFSKDCSQVNFTGTNNANVCFSSLGADRKLTFLLSIMHSLYLQYKAALRTGTKICS